MTTSNREVLPAGRSDNEPCAGSDFAPLLRSIRAAHLLDRRRLHYAARVALWCGAYLACWGVFLRIGDSWYQTVVAVVLGVLFTQVAFIGHDAGHRQVARTRRVNDAIGLVVGDLLVGLSYGWWVGEHNQHHAHPNYEGVDPDIGESVITFTDEQAGERKGGVERFIAAHQAALFFPLLTLEGLNLHMQSVEWLGQRRTRRHRRTELVLLGLHVLGYLALVLLVLSPVKALVFVAIQQAAWGVYMGCSFAPNHKGMPTVRPGERLDYLRRQVITTRNVRGGRFVDVLLGGLNYQIEHHLFPSMPRANLRKAQPIVREYCAQLGIPYVETGVLDSYAQALHHLHAVGAPIRVRRRARVGLGVSVD